MQDRRPIATPVASPYSTVGQNRSDGALRRGTGRAGAIPDWVEKLGRAGMTRRLYARSSSCSDFESNAMPWPSRAIISNAFTNREVTTVATMKRCPCRTHSCLRIRLRPSGPPSPRHRVRSPYSSPCAMSVCLRHRARQIGFSMFSPQPRPTRRLRHLLTSRARLVRAMPIYLCRRLCEFRS